MKKWSISVLSLLAVTLLVLCSIWGNRCLPALPAGGALCAADAAAGTGLYGWTDAGDGSWRFTFTPAMDESELVLFFGNTGSRPLAPALRTDRTWGYPDTAWPLAALSAGQPVTLTVACAVEPNAWLVRADTLYHWCMLRTILQWIALTGMAFMCLFALALYCYKHEPYLLYFLAYSIIMLVWGALIYAFPDSRGSISITFFSRLCFSFMLLGGLWLGVGLTQTPWPAWIPQKLRSWPTILAASVALSVLQYVLSGWPRLLLVCGSMVLLLAILLAAQARGLHGSGILVAGAVITAGLRPLVLLPGMDTIMYPESLPFYMVRAARIYDLPFALACMLFLCRRFALQFDRTEQLAQELDRRVAARTQELTEQQEARKSLMLNIFHDLRSPLFVLQNCLSTLEAAPARLPALLPVLQERTAFVHNLTEDLFLAAKLEQNQILLNEDRVAFSEEVQQVCTALACEAEKKGIRLTVSCNASLWVWGDSLRLRQVAQNLITNAIYYTPEGGHVLVSTDAQKEEALLRVADTGCGIAPADQASVFHRYFHTTTQNKHDSSGLGLTIAQELVQLHHGTITLESQLGKGSIFTVHLPLLPTQENS